MSNGGPSEKVRLLGIFAHPDDETFCAGGTLAKYAQAGAEIMVVSATPGNAGQIRDAHVATRRTLGQVRAGELRRACQKLGVKHVECWNYEDGTLHDVDQAGLVEDVVRVIRSFRPNIVLSFGPDGGYGHPDHIAISHATTAACKLSGDADQYPEHLAEGLSVHEPDRLYYAHFPQNRLQFSQQLVRWLVSFEDRFLGSLDFVNALMLLSEETTMLRFTNDHVDIDWFPAGFYIVEQGEPPDKLFLILSGKAEVVHEDAHGNLHQKDTLGPGRFFGEDGLAYDQPRSAHVIAAESVTCLVLSPEEPALFAGRGEGAKFTGQDDDDSDAGEARPENAVPDPEIATTRIDVRDFVEQKIGALAQHRTQFPIQPDMFPLPMLQDLFGREFFVQVIPESVLESELI
jgi:LmbE family N-acetylglucosaminyl deacetylase